MNIRLRLIVIFLLVVFLLIGFGISAISIYRTNLAETETIWLYTRDELNFAHDAQIAFERQKLAWDNMILRGYDAERYYRYLSQFYASERQTRTAIGALIASLPQNAEPAQAARSFLMDHKRLGKRYREALKIYNAADDPAFATDRYIWDAVENPSELLDEVTKKVVAYHGVELDQLNKKVQSDLQYLWILVLIVLVLSLAGLVWVVDRRIGRPLGAIIEVARSIRDGDIKQRVPPQSADEFGVLAESINDMLDRLENVNRSLAAKLVELEGMNQELESFSYTIAHDLRGPLRAITGFSQLLQEDLKGSINSEQQDALDRISAAGLRMAGQIDHILQLSRISRSPLKVMEVDLSGLAQEVIQELRDHEPEREVEVEIQPELHVRGDAALLRVVMQNLLGNAWKYTRNEPRPFVRFSASTKDGHTIFHVSDNGVGFDMGYSHKLFGVFERLHRAEEFEGTGVGLASVQRAIRRHGGWIDGKGEPGVGAEFCFSLDTIAQAQAPDRAVPESETD